MSEKLRCMCCMHIVPDGLDTCPYCGEFPFPNQNVPYLPIGSTIAGRYLVGKALYVYAEGVTYMGYDTLHDIPVEIREFLPLNIIKRDSSDLSIRVKVDAQQTYYSYLQSFITMWRSIMRVRDKSAIAEVIDLITNENLTAYVILEHIDAVSLDDYLFSHSLKLPWDDVKKIFTPALYTLEDLHSHKIVHGAISPSTLFVAKNDRLLISGFAIPEFCNEEGGYIFHGYSPVECYNSGYPIGTWTDIYSFTACMYHAITGLIPPNAQQRAVKDQLMIQREIVSTLPGGVIKTLFGGMRILPPDRIKTTYELRGEVPGKLPDEAVNEEEASAQETDEDGYIRPEINADELLQTIDEQQQQAEEALAQSLDETTVVDDGSVKPDFFDGVDEEEEEAEKKKPKQKGGAKAFLLTFLISFLALCLAFAVAYPLYLHKLLDIPMLQPYVDFVGTIPVLSDIIPNETKSDEIPTTEANSTEEQDTQAQTNETTASQETTKASSKKKNSSAGAETTAQDKTEGTTKQEKAAPTGTEI